MSTLCFHNDGDVRNLINIVMEGSRVERIRGVNVDGFGDRSLFQFLY